MALFVYPADTLREDAKKQGVAQDKIKRFCDEVERTQSISTFDRFPPPYLTRKRIWSYNNRLIAAEHSVGEHLVIVLLRLLVKSSRDYEHQFVCNPHAYADPLLQAAIPKAEMWLAERTRLTPPPAMPRPSTLQEDFLWAEVGVGTDADSIVCETERWIHSGMDARIQARLVLIPDLLVELARGEDRGPRIAFAKGDPRLSMAYRWFSRDRLLLLMDIGYDKAIDPDTSLAEYTCTIPQGEQLDVLRITRRSYPIEVCCDADMWLAIQHNVASNMAMSPEEIGVLRSARTIQPDTGFPLFINGRAGSGKSTLLQYLFADYFAAWAKHLSGNGSEVSSIPLYLASSRELLDTAESAVRGLLTINAAVVMRGEKLSPRALSFLSRAFCRPVDHLTRTVASSGHRNRFEYSLYVNYPRFRRLWFDQFGRDQRACREYGPQLSWHVIRTHIKGQCADAELEPGDYDSLPRNEHTVSHERYQQVYERVWENWYQPICKEKGYWDDQDLAAEAAKPEFKGCHSAIFCDESQDFTRRELEALHRCCAFSFMELTPDEAARVPFVFAGDPFQTLNPTGFRWEAVRAAFTEKIAGNLYRYRQRAQLPEINYRELTYNYRSSQHIVKLCNSIQAIRAVVMHETSLRPQTTWHLDATAPLPTCFHITEPTIRQDIRGQADLVLIVPCEDDGESEYVEEHPSIAALVKRGPDGIPQNVLSPARAKGLEFNRVAVVGFGSAPEAATLAQCIAEPQRMAGMKNDESLPLEYFLNKLYVACSRARRRLFIIDEPTDLQRLWGFALDDEILQDVCGRVPAANQAWREGVGHIAKGLAEHLRDDQNDPLETAARFESDGDYKQDPYLLLQAALQYELAEDNRKAADCRGRAYVHQRKPVRAADCFLEAGNMSRALECFWEGGKYEKVIEVAERDPSVRGRVECRLSALLGDTNGESGNALQLLQEVVERGNSDATLRSRLGHDGWPLAMKSLIERASDSLDSRADPGCWVTLANIHHQLVDLGVVVDDMQRAKALLGAGLYDQVVEVLRSKPDTKIYQQAKMQIALRAREEGKEANISAEDKRLVGDMLRSGRAFGDALWWYQAAPSQMGLEASIEDLADTRDDELGRRFIDALARLAAQHDDWEYLLCLIAENGWPTISGLGRSFLKNVRSRMNLTRDILTPVVGVSDAVMRAAPGVRDRLCHQIRISYCKPINSWNTEHMQEARFCGAAIERVGRDIDALTFYEAIVDDESYPAEMKDYANRRWIRCKLRQEKRERSHDRRPVADKYKEQVESRLRTFDWTQEDLGPEYPDRRLVEKGYDQEAKSSPRQERAGTEIRGGDVNRWHLGPLTFDRFRTSNRINITSSIGEQARINLVAHEVISDEVDVERTSKEEWYIAHWGLRITLSADEGAMQFEVGAEHSQITLGNA
jgi:hypothetical protein